MSLMHVRPPGDAAGKQAESEEETFGVRRKGREVGEGGLHGGLMILSLSRRCGVTEGDSQWDVGAVRRGEGGGGWCGIVGGRERGRCWYFYAVTSR